MYLCVNILLYEQFKVVSKDKIEKRKNEVYEK